MYCNENDDSHGKSHVTGIVYNSINVIIVTYKNSYTKTIAMIVLQEQIISYKSNKHNVCATAIAISNGKLSIHVMITV